MMNLHWTITYGLSSFLALGWLISTVLGNDERQLFRDLFDNYTSEVRPRKEPMESVEIEIELELHQLKELDEKNQILSTIGFIEATWHDDYLHWNPDDYGNVTELVVPPNNVWLPDFGIHNSAAAFYEELYFEHFRVWMDNNGTVKWSFGGLFSTACDLDTTFYPMDVQTCKFKVENWCYSMQFVNLFNATPTVPLNDFYPHGLWSVIGTTAKREEIRFDSDPDNAFPRVTFEIHLKRKPRYYVINIMVPCCFLTFIALLVYVLPPESGEKVSLGVTVLLAFSVFQFVIADHTPVNSDCTPLLSIFVAATMGLSTMSVVTTVLVLYIHHEAADTPIPPIIRYIAFRIISPLVCFGVQQTSSDRNLSPQLLPDNDIEDGGSDIKMTTTSLAQTAVVAGVTDCQQSCQHRSELRRIRLRLERLSSYFNMKAVRLADRDAAEAISEDWRALAKIVDRFLLNLTIIGIVAALIWMYLYGRYVQTQTVLPEE